MVRLGGSEEQQSWGQVRFGEAERWARPCLSVCLVPSLSLNHSDLHPSDTEIQSSSIVHHPHTNTDILLWDQQEINTETAGGVGGGGGGGGGLTILLINCSWTGLGQWAWHTNYWCKNYDKNLTPCQKCSIIRQSWFIIKDDKLNGQNGWKTVFCQKFLPFNHKTVLSAAAQAGLIRPLKCRAFNYSQRNSKQIFLFY